MASVRGKVLDKMRKSFQKVPVSDDVNSDNGEEILPNRVTHLTPALIEEARTQLNETEENRQKGLAALKQMIQDDPDFTSLTDDLFLMAFLRARKFDVQKAFKLIRSYWMFRKDHRKILDITEYAPVRVLILRGFVGLLEHRDRRGCHVFVAKFGLWNPDLDSYEDFFRASTAILLYAMQHEATQIAGFRIIFDVRGVGWAQLKYATFPFILLVINATQFCYPGRCKGIHIINDNKMFGFAWSVIYPFLTQKIKKRVFFYGKDLSPLRDFIHPSVLPEEFGGDAPRFNTESWPEIMDSVSEGIMDHLTYGYKN